MLIYGECGRNARAAARMYAQRFPIRLPDITIKTMQSNMTRGNWPPIKRNRQRPATGADNEVAVIQAIKENPHVGQNALAREIGISQSSVSRIILANKFHPYHCTLVQDLKP
ncbi:unnamed protein product [Tenebrio molitor]|nr:unnamed protein product [Tenebrio molitor]